MDDEVRGTRHPNPILDRYAGLGSGRQWRPSTVAGRARSRDRQLRLGAAFGDNLDEFQAFLRLIVLAGFIESVRGLRDCDLDLRLVPAIHAQIAVGALQPDGPAGREFTRSVLVASAACDTPSCATTGEAAAMTPRASQSNASLRLMIWPPSIELVPRPPSEYTGATVHGSTRPVVA